MMHMCRALRYYALPLGALYVKHSPPGDNLLQYRPISSNMFVKVPLNGTFAHEMTILLEIMFISQMKKKILLYLYNVFLKVKYFEFLPI